jgi:hypothetical protein
MPKIDTSSVPSRKGSGYPSPFDEPCAARTRRRLGNAGGLCDFGVNLMTLPPGNWSSQRHWHSHEDEFVYLLEGPTPRRSGARLVAVHGIELPDCGRSPAPAVGRLATFAVTRVRDWRRAARTAVSDCELRATMS